MRAERKFLVASGTDSLVSGFRSQPRLPRTEYAELASARS
jgi:hypothetical protein